MTSRWKDPLDPFYADEPPKAPAWKWTDEAITLGSDSTIWRLSGNPLSTGTASLTITKGEVEGRPYVRVTDGSDDPSMAATHEVLDRIEKEHGFTEPQAVSYL